MDNKLDLKTVKKYAPARAFERGSDYYHSGLVRSIDKYDGVIIAKVSGTHIYTVRLNIEVDGDFDYSCTCPMGDEGEFCKHCVRCGAGLDQPQRKEWRKKIVCSHSEQYRKNYLNTLNKTALCKVAGCNRFRK